MPNIVSQERFIQEALEAHNKYRTRHGADPVEHEPQLSSLAKEWAEKLAEKGSLSYRKTTFKNQELGENILRFNLKNANVFYVSGGDISHEWYQEEQNYAYDGKCTPETGHFTQIVWKSTQKVGFGFAMDESGLFYVVANYFPAGNYTKRFKENVLPVQELKKTSDNFKDIMKQFLNHKTTTEEEPIDEYIDHLDESIETENYVFSEMQNRFISEALTCHNKCRQKHGVPDLTHNPELSMIAQGYAEKLAKMNKMIHSTNKYADEKIGENLAYSYDSQLNFYPGQKATMQWYDEIKMHNFNLDYQKGTGHFTQLVWKGTREVGFGVAKANDGSFYAVANYYPAGNFIGRFIQNVPKPLK